MPGYVTVKTLDEDPIFWPHINPKRYIIPSGRWNLFGFRIQFADAYAQNDWDIWPQGSPLVRLRFLPVGWENRNDWNSLQSSRRHKSVGYVSALFVGHNLRDISYNSGCSSILQSVHLPVIDAYTEPLFWFFLLCHGFYLHSVCNLRLLSATFIYHLAV